MSARARLWRQSVVKVQRIRVPDTGHLSWIVVDGEHHPVGVLNEYLLYLHRLGRSPNTVRAYAHHLQSFYVVHVSKPAMALYADYLVHEYGEASHDYVFVNWWGGQVGSPMRYATVIGLFRQLSKRTGLGR
jgi:hypothetical protein